MERFKTGSDGSGTQLNVQINNVQSQSPNGDLPGPGQLGTIKFNISHRTMKQLESPRVDSGEKYLEGIEMLGADDIPDLVTRISQDNTDE